MTTLTIIIVYLTGVVLSYLFNRWIYSDDWTVKLRTMYLLLAIFSWANLFIDLLHGFVNLLKISLKNNNKAKW